MTEKWVRFTKRTNDPKLSWIESKLLAAGIPNQRNGFSFHAPILEVPEERLTEAWQILELIDDIPDDDPVFVEDVGGCSCGPRDGGAESICVFCAVDDLVAKIRVH